MDTCIHCLVSHKEAFILDLCQCFDLYFNKSVFDGAVPRIDKKLTPKH